MQARGGRRRCDGPCHDLLVRLGELPHGGGAVDPAARLPGDGSRARRRHQRRRPLHGADLQRRRAGPRPDGGRVHERNLEREGDVRPVHPGERPALHDRRQPRAQLFAQRRRHAHVGRGVGLRPDELQHVRRPRRSHMRTTSTSPTTAISPARSSAPTRRAALRATPSTSTSAASSPRAEATSASRA